MVEIRQQKARQCVTTRSDSEWPMDHDLPVSRARLSCLLWLARSPTVQRPCCTLWMLPDLPATYSSAPLLSSVSLPFPSRNHHAPHTLIPDTTRHHCCLSPRTERAQSGTSHPHTPPSPTQCHLLTYSDGLIDGLPSLRPVGTLNTGSPASRRGRTRPRSRTSATATLLLALYRRRHHLVTRRAEQYLPRRRSCFRLTRLFSSHCIPTSACRDTCPHAGLAPPYTPRRITLCIAVTAWRLLLDRSQAGGTDSRLR